MIKISEVPWSLAVIFISVLVALMIILGLIGYELDTNNSKVRLVKSEQIELGEVLKQDKANLVCASFNAFEDKIGWASAYEMSDNNTCSNFCRAQPDDHDCLGTLAIHNDNRHYGKWGCSDQPTEYDRSNGTVYCCCL